MVYIISAVYPGLQGVKNELSTSTDGGIIWNDRSYTFTDLPDFLVGVSFFQTPLFVQMGTSINVVINQRSTIYISSDVSYTGGYDISLPYEGWLQQDRNIGTSWSGLNVIR